MKTISFTPNYGANNYLNANKPVQAYYTPSFTGTEKIAQKAKPKAVTGLVSRIYGLFFGGEGRVKMIRDGHVYTEAVVHKNNGKCVVSNKLPLWSNTPEATVIDNLKMKRRTKISYNQDKTKNIEVRDMHDPNYKVSAEYKSVSDPDDYDGAVLLNYCGKSAEILPSQRKQIIEELDKDIEKIDIPTQEIFRMPREEFKKYYDMFFQNPSVIGRAILSSPAKLEKQLDIVPASMPYGIEAIFGKLSK